MTNGTGWDPVPHLAALIDGLHDMAAAWPDERDEIFGRLLAGPYSALHGGLLLDEPGREHESTEAAIRLALAGRDAAGTEYR